MLEETHPPTGEELDGSPNHNTLITKELVEACLREDKGQEATLLSFEEKEITTKGENFMSVVTSVLVRYRLCDSEDLRTSYVVKLNPQREYDDSNKTMKEYFVKESGFYHEVGPALNRELRKAGLPELRNPKSPFAQLTEGKEIIFMDNLGEQGFKMVDYRVGLDKNHCLLVVKELARLHGAFFLLQKKSKVDILTSYPYMNDREEYEVYAATFGGLIKCCASIARLNQGYDKVAEYLEKELAPKSTDFVREHLKPRDPFAALVHGDCWTNNILFRYDSDGVPVETMLVDFQVMRRASPTIDLSYLFFTSLSGQVRRRNKDLFLGTYFDVLQEVIQAGGHELDFTFKELCEEYERHCMYGIFFALIIASIVYGVPCGGFDLDKIKEGSMNEVMREQEEILVSLQENPDVKVRFFSIFDDMVENGIVC